MPSADASGDRPVTILLAALGGEGGSVLAGWIESAARSCGLVVQGTSVPGVAQRTGATTYYIELMPRRLEGRRPVLALMPTPGFVDLMVATELLEAARAITAGWVTRDRTTLVASSHRVFTMGEKSAMGDGRHDVDAAVATVRRAARHTILFDMNAMRAEAGAMINAVAFGAIAAAGLLPFPKEAFEDAIRRGGASVAANLRGFELGFHRAGDDAVAVPYGAADRALADPGAMPMAALPEPARANARAGLARVRDWGGEAAGRLYLDRLATVAAVDARTDGAARGFVLTQEAARYLALRMSYEDIVRVADLKTRSRRFERLRQEVGARPDEELTVTEFLKPGIEEFCALMPGFIAHPLMKAVERRGWRERLHVGVHLKTSTVSGFALLWLAGRLRVLRPWTSRYADEQADIDGWLDVVREAAQLDQAFGLEVVECARLVKGYGDTLRRGMGNYRRIIDAVVRPALAAGRPDAVAVARARDAALADPEGDALERALAQIDAGRRLSAAGVAVAA